MKLQIEATIKIQKENPEIMASLAELLQHAQDADKKMDLVLQKIADLKAALGTLTPDQQAAIDAVDAALTDLSGKEDAATAP